jgi:hypothetical protein
LTTEQTTPIGGGEVSLTLAEREQAVAKQSQVPAESKPETSGKKLKITWTQWIGAFFLSNISWRCTDWAGRFWRRIIIVITRPVAAIFIWTAKAIKWMATLAGRSTKRLFSWPAHSAAIDFVRNSKTWNLLIRVGRFVRARFQERVADESDSNLRQRIEAIARVVFFVGVIANLADGILTWIAVNDLGTSVEGNGLMSRAMNYFGYRELITFKIFFGTLIFWIMANSLKGRRFFLKPSHALSYRLKMNTGGFGFFAVMTLGVFFALFAMIFVVGNDYRAIMTLFNKQWI